MTNEQLNDHRDNFERQYMYDNDFEITDKAMEHRGDSYVSQYTNRAWKAYQWAIADAENGANGSNLLANQIEEAFTGSTRGLWGKGSSTHETVARNEGKAPYKIGDFRHASDAQFCDVMHALAPEIITALRCASAQPVEVRLVPLTTDQLTEGLRLHHLTWGQLADGFRAGANWAHNNKPTTAQPVNALHRNYPKDTLAALHEAFLTLPICPLLSVVGNAIQEIQSLQSYQNLPGNHPLTVFAKGDCSRSISY